MKILTDDHWQVLMEHQEWLKDRVEALEAQVSGLLDRLLIEKGQVPLNMNLHEEMKEQEKAHHDLFEQLTADEVGDEPKDERDEREKPDVV